MTFPLLTEFAAPLAGNPALPLLHNELRNKTKKSFIGLVTEVQKHLTTDLSPLLDLLKNLNPTRHFSPEFYCYYFTLLTHMVQQNNETAFNLCNTLNLLPTSDNFYHDKFVITSNTSSIMMELYKNNLGDDKKYKREEITTVSSFDYQEVSSYIQRSFNIIANNTHLSEEINEIISAINIFDGGGKASNASSVGFFGLIMMRYHRFNSQAEQLLYFFDSIIHEAAHNYLNLLITFDPMIINSKEFFFSPARNTNRPMKGIFHGHFVVFRLIMAYRLLEKFFAEYFPTQKLDAYDFNRPLADLPMTFYPRLEAYQYKFKQGESIIQQSAQLTEFGREFFNNMSSIIHHD